MYCQQPDNIYRDIAYNIRNLSGSLEFLYIYIFITCTILASDQLNAQIIVL